METIKELKQEQFDKFKSDDKFIHSVAFAHDCVDGRGNLLYKKALTKYTIAGEDFKVSDDIVKQAQAIYQIRKNNIIQNINNKLVFVGMGSSFKPIDNNHIGNHRIRTYFKNKNGILCFVEFGAGIDNTMMRCAHAIMNTRKNINEWKSLNEREKTEIRLRIENDINLPYTKENILHLVNENFGCDFKEVEVYDYFIDTDDFTCEN